MQLGQREVRWIAACILALAVASCATAGQEDPGVVDGAVGTPDGSVHSDASPIADAAPGTPDARPLPDAYVPPDAHVPPDAYVQPDAMAGGLCDSNDDCIPAECCYLLICVPGERVLTYCIPSE